MRGLSISINMVAAVAVLLLVLVSVSLFFASSSAQFGSEIEAKSYFVTTCPQLRCGYETSAVLKDEYQRYFEACKLVLGPQAEEKPYQCLQQCGCSAEVDEEEIQENIDAFVALLKK